MTTSYMAWVNSYVAYSACKTQSELRLPAMNFSIR